MDRFGSLNNIMNDYDKNCDDTDLVFYCKNCNNSLYSGDEYYEFNINGEEVQLCYDCVDSYICGLKKEVK